MNTIVNLVRCEKGHFYDAGKYDVCPHCQSTQTIEQTMFLIQQDEGEQISAPQQKKNPEVQTQAEPVSVSPTDYSGASDDSKTVQYYQKTLGTEPVVGWLVCVNGMHLGQDFRIKSGRNFIGRSGSMDICLCGDTAVSRERAAIITYDPKSNTFFMQPGDSSALCYINDAPLLEVTALRAKDRLTVGETELVFVPFCDDTFSWKN